MTVCLTALLGEEGSVGIIVQQSIDAMRYEIKKKKILPHYVENSAARPHNMYIILFCKKLPNTWLVRIRSIVSKVQK